MAAIGHALQSCGIDPVEVFRAAGLVEVPGSDPLLRVDAATIARIYQIARVRTGDEYIGLRVAQRMRPTHLHAIGPGLLASSTLRDFLDRFVRFFPLISSALSVDWRMRASDAVLEASDVAEQAPFESDDVFCGYLARLITEVSGDAVAPKRIELRRPSPPDGGRVHAAHFGCPVSFGTAGLAIVLSGECLEVPLPGSNPEIADYADVLALRYLAQLDRRDIENRVRLIVLRELAKGGVSKADVAGELYMSPSTLQQKLAARNTTFSAVVEDVRRALAVRYLRDRSRPISEIAYLLGFAGASGFCRAYRRWTGRAPGDDRP